MNTLESLHIAISQVEENPTRRKVEELRREVRRRVNEMSADDYSKILTRLERILGSIDNF